MRFINKTPEFRDAVRDVADSQPESPPWLHTQINPVPDIKATAHEAIDVYLSNRKPDGTIEGIGWWQCANGFTAIADQDRWLGDEKYYDSLADSLRRCEQINSPHGFVNDFNDDSCWWAICCVRLYGVKRDRWFLSQARAVWGHVKQYQLAPQQRFFQGKDMAGAVLWTSKAGEDSINAISTALFAELGLRLALEHDDPLTEARIDAARHALGWILRSRYRSHEGVVLDHIKLDSQQAIDWTFTYNTGVTLSSLALLYSVTGEVEYLLIACHMAHKSMTRSQWVEDNGVLTEPDAYGKGQHDPQQNSDGVGFKAVLMRQLCTLYHVIDKMQCPPPKARRVAAMIHAFVYINFHTQLDKNTDGKGRYGPWWNGPFEYPTVHSQLAVLDVMAAAMLVNFG
ncbi:glycosyl hydrolase family 76-domain-containing protein [Neohortaea acidophila]|uniref:Glycosyl hydrolase family 76-domain-containing protein n=1 Tax=Neohortaea acidophila TaxID=245834 RepID=A0A6A6Q2P1_9PEZI|nr:glycosyl hydrolase family 76-domain-containing protein [Neohortaea acidophila]KAF2486254.1 glycosyl hydrolase family 76-domain-containing protein [Neohortaea acidophila]